MSQPLWAVVGVFLGQLYDSFLVIKYVYKSVLKIPKLCTKGRCYLKRHLSGTCSVIQQILWFHCGFSAVFDQLLPEKSGTGVRPKFWV